MLLALEVRKVPASGDEVGPHTLYGVHEHAGALDGGRLAILYDMASSDSSGPKSMDDVSIWLLEVVTEIGVSSLGTFSDLEAGNGGGPTDVERDLEVVGKIDIDGIGFGVFERRVGRFRKGLVSDGELVGSARSFVEIRRGSGEVGDIDGTPGGLLGVRVVNPAGGLHGRIPYAEGAIE